MSENSRETQPTYGAPLPWMLYGRCRVCDVPENAEHQDACWLSLSLLWMRQRCAEGSVSEPASAVERPYQPSPQEAAQQVFDLVAALTEFGYGSSVTIDMPGGNALTVYGSPAEKGSQP